MEGIYVGLSLGWKRSLSLKRLLYRHCLIARYHDLIAFVMCDQEIVQTAIHVLIKKRKRKRKTFIKPEIQSYKAKSILKLNQLKRKKINRKGIIIRNCLKHSRRYFQNHNPTENRGYSG